MNNKYLRMLTPEEIEKIDIGKLENHDYIRNREMIKKGVDMIISSIKQHGIFEPIELFEGEIINGRTRIEIAIALEIPTRDIPFAEYIGPKDKESVVAWINRQYQRGEDDPTAKIIRLIEYVWDELLCMKENGDYRTHDLYRKGMSLNDLAAEVLDLSVANVKNGKKVYNLIKEEEENGRNYMQLFECMREGIISFEDVHKIFKPNTWLKSKMTDKEKNAKLKWMNKILQFITEPKIVNMLEIAKGKLLLQPTTVIPTPIKDVKLEDCNIDAEIVIKIPRKYNESKNSFEKRKEAINEILNEKLREIALLIGHSKFNVISGQIGCGMFDEAMKNIIVKSGDCEEVVDVIKVEAPSDFNPEEVENCKVTTIRPSRKTK